MLISKQNELWFESYDENQNSNFLYVYNNDEVKTVSMVNQVHKIVGNWTNVFIAD